MPAWKWSVSNKVTIALEGLIRDANISEICRRYVVAERFIIGGHAFNLLLDLPLYPI